MKIAEQITDEMMAAMFKDHHVKSEPDDKVLDKAVEKVVMPLQETEEHNSEKVSPFREPLCGPYASSRS